MVELFVARAVRSVFTGNTSTGKSTNGGAIFLQNAGASAEIINCTFTENTATNYGGAVEQNNNVPMFP